MADLDPRPVRRGRTVQRLHRQRRSCGHRARQLRDKILEPGSDARTGVLRERGACRVHGAGLQRGRHPRPCGQRRRHRRPPSRALADLRHRRVNALFAADLFNEGLDIPDVDTVLFLRPTESATIFLQQLGRGLRRTRDKAVLTVLDFVGYQGKQFSWGSQAPGAHGAHARGSRAPSKWVPVPPLGMPDRAGQASPGAGPRQPQVSDRQPVAADRGRTRSYGDHELASFSPNPALSCRDILRPGTRSWTRFRRDAGLPTLTWLRA